MRFGIVGRRCWRAGLIGLAALSAFAATGPIATAADDGFSDSQKAEIGTLVRNYLMQHPDVLRDAMVELDRQEKLQDAAKRNAAVQSKAGKLFDSPYGDLLGNPQGKVTLVEFFDYNCGYCKRALDDLSKLMKSEPNLKVVLKDFPVLGPGSVEAAQVAGAVRNQLKGDKFWAFHSKLLATRGPVGKAQALLAAKDAGADMDQLTEDMGKPEVAAGIEENMQLADALKLTGTPSYVVGPDVVEGAVGYDQLRGRLDNLLKCGKSMCS